MSDRHPIWNEPINTWSAPEGQSGPKWIAKFGIGRNFPIFFEGATQRAVLDSAEAFRADVTARHEASYLARLHAVEMARLARKAKAARGAPIRSHDDYSEV